ncbi:MAG TPA: EAL domain-containing protein [Dongiaceae bacterium]|nr:EAL domain-containing protein [Dongiaceae bacterium]
MDAAQQSASQADILADAIFNQLSNSENSFADTMSCLVQSVRKRLGMEVAFVSEFVDGNRMFRFVDSQDGVDIIAPGQGGPLDESYCQRVVDGRLPELIPDAQQLPSACVLPVTRSLPVGAHVSVPIRLTGGGVFGTFCTFSRYGDEHLDERDLAMVRVFADLAGALISKHLSVFESVQQARSRISDLMSNDQLILVGQPIVDLQSGETMGYELLSRVGGPDHIPPDVLFDQASRVGLSNALGVRTVEKARQVLRRVSGGPFIALNLTPDFILNNNVADLFGSDPIDNLVLEITEHAVIKDYTALRERLEPLRRRGARVAIDDAGAGYASLRHILQLMPDIIKLDISLIKDIDRDSERQALATALISFSRCRRYHLIAEGIERAEELATLQSLGTEWGQGYFFARPQPLPVVWN